MTGQILDCLWIDASMDHVGNIGVTQLMGSYLEIQTVDDVFPVHAFLTGLRLELLLDCLPIHVFVQRPFLGSPDSDIVPDPVELRV